MRQRISLRTKPLRTIAFILVGIVGILACAILSPPMLYYFSRDVPNQIAMFEAQLNIPAVQTRYQHLVEELKVTISDTLLEDHLGDVWISESAPSCIRGGGYLIYGSQAMFDEVWADYRTAFEERQWINSSVVSQSTNSRVNFHNVSETMYISLSQISPSAFDYSGDRDYESYFRVDVTYAEPRVASCFG